MTSNTSRFSMVPVGTTSLTSSRRPPSPVEPKDFLAFVLGEEHYAIPLSSIREIMKLPYVTEVPLAPPNVIGIISVRGRVTTLIDMRRLLKMPEQEPTAKSRVLLVDEGDEIVGLLIDRVLQVYRLSAEEVELSSTIGGEQTTYVTGIGRPGLSRRREERRDVVLADGRTHRESSSDIEESIGAEILILLDPKILLHA
jgi:purine-binding chemotaxis protein CheW